MWLSGERRKSERARRELPLVGSTPDMGLEAASTQEGRVERRRRHMGRTVQAKTAGVPEMHAARGGGEEEATDNRGRAEVGGSRSRARRLAKRGAQKEEKMTCRSRVPDMGLKTRGRAETTKEKRFSFHYAGGQRDDLPEDSQSSVHAIPGVVTGQDEPRRGYGSLPVSEEGRKSKRETARPGCGLSLSSVAVKLLKSYGARGGRHQGASSRRGPWPRVEERSGHRTRRGHEPRHGYMAVSEEGRLEERARNGAASRLTPSL